MDKQTKTPQGRALVAQLDKLFKASVTRLRDDIETYITHGTLPDPASRTDGSYAYPEIHIFWSGDSDSAEPQRSLGGWLPPAIMSPASPSPHYLPII